MILITTHHHLWLAGKSIRSFNRRQNALVWASCCHADAYRVATPPLAGRLHSVFTPSERPHADELIGTSSDSSDTCCGRKWGLMSCSHSMYFFFFRVLSPVLLFSLILPAWHLHSDELKGDFISVSKRLVIHEIAVCIACAAQIQQL